MKESKLHQQIANKEIDKEKIAEQVIQQPELLSDVFNGLEAKKASLKSGSEKVLRIISEKKPELLYPKIDFFIKNLNNENNFLKWGAIRVIGNLTTVDNKNRFEAIFDKYFSPISGPVLITANNIIETSAKIVVAKPALVDKITKELLKVENATYKTDECQNIALGKMIETFGIYFNKIEDKEPVIQLVKNQLNNSRNSTRKKAEKFLKKFRINC